MKRLHAAGALLASGYLLAGCGQAAMEADFVQACMKQNNREVTEAHCKCMAHETVANMPPKFQHAMLLDMQGKKQEAEELMKGVEFEERAKFGMKQFEIVAGCMGGGG